MVGGPCAPASVRRIDSKNRAVRYIVSAAPSDFAMPSRGFAGIVELYERGCGDRECGCRAPGGPPTGGSRSGRLLDRLLHRGVGLLDREHGGRGLPAELLLVVGLGTAASAAAAEVVGEGVGGQLMHLLGSFGTGASADSLWWRIRPLLRTRSHLVRGGIGQRFLREAATGVPGQQIGEEPQRSGAVGERMEDLQADASAVIRPPGTGACGDPAGRSGRSWARSPPPPPGADRCPGGSTRTRRGAGPRGRAGSGRRSRRAPPAAAWDRPRGPSRRSSGTPWGPRRCGRRGRCSRRCPGGPSADG